MILNKNNEKQLPNPPKETEGNIDSVKALGVPKHQAIETVRVELTSKGDLETLKETGKALQQRINTESLGIQVQSMIIDRGALIMKVKAKSENGSRTFCEAIKGHLQEQGKIELLTKRNTILIRDVDPLTTEDDITRVILETLNTKTPVVVNMSNKQENRKQTAFVTLPELQANTLLKTGRIKIGWIHCRVCEFLTPIKCYGCQQYGHKAENCKTEKGQMKDKCLRCCQSGHIAKDCSAEAKCYQCLGKDHSAGTMNCPAYRKLVTDLRNKKNKKSTTEPPTI